MPIFMKLQQIGQKIVTVSNIKKIHTMFHPTFGIDCSPP